MGPILRCITLLGLLTSLPPPTIHGRHLRQQSPPFDQWTPLFPPHPPLGYQHQPNNEDLSAQASVNQQSFTQSHTLSQFPKQVRFEQSSDSEQFSREFSPHAFQFTGTGKIEHHKLSKNPVNIFRGSFSNDDNTSSFPDAINPFLNKHVSVLRFPSDFVRVDTSSELTAIRGAKKNLTSSDFGRPSVTPNFKVSFQTLPRDGLAKEREVGKYTNNPLVSDYRRGLVNNENIRWNEQQGEQKEFEERVKVLVDSKGIKFSPVRDNNVPEQTTYGIGGHQGSVIAGEPETSSNAKKSVKIKDDPNDFTQQTHDELTVIRLKGISLELPPFGSRKTNSSFRLPLPLHPIFQINSNRNKELTQVNPQAGRHFNDEGSVLQSSESQRSVRKIVSSQGSKGSKYDKCAHPFHAWMCPQVLNSPPRQNIPKLTTPRTLLQNANFNAPNSQPFSFSVATSTTTESPINEFGKIQFEDPFNRITSFPTIVTARPVLMTTTQRRSGSTLFGEPIYTTPVPKLPQISTISGPTIQPSITKKRVKSGSLLLDRLVTIPPMPSSKLYNKCSHTFHSWLCAKQPTTPVTTTAGPKSINGSPFSDSSFNVGVGSDPDPLPVPKTMEPTPKTYQKCSHAFHSWLCPKLLVPVVNRSTIPPPPTTPLRSGSGNLPEVTSPRAGSINVPDIVSAEPRTTTTEPPITTRRGSVNFPVPQVLSTTPTPSPFRTTQKIETTAITPQHKPYDKCSHSFHSWLCQKPIRTRLSSIAVPSRSILNNPIALPKTTTEKSTTSIAKTTRMKPKKGSTPFSEPINQEKSLFPDLDPEPPSTTTPKPKTKIDICSHPLHAWICSSPTTTSKPRGKSIGELDSEPDKIKKGSQLFPEPQTTTSRSRERTTTKSTWDGVDPCTHAFHSWLCKPSHRRLTIPSIVKPARGRNAQASFPKNSVFLFSNAESTTQKPTTLPHTSTTPSKKGGLLDSDPQTTKSSKPPSTIKPRRRGGLNAGHIEMKKKSDPCDHPFHSYLCPRSTSLAPPVQRRPSTARGKSFDSLPSNVRPNPPKKGQIDVSDPIPLKSRPSSTPKYDKCSHPFHSWLCEVARNIGQESQISSAAIDAYIDSDRFLLKTANLPNIRKLPLDTEGTSHPFFPTNFINMNQVLASEVRSANSTTSHESTNFKVIYSDENIRSYQQIRTTSPSQSEINFGQKIVPTLPTINRTRKISVEEPGTLTAASYDNEKFGEINTSIRVATIPPSPLRGFKSPKLISFDINDIPTVPPRPARDIDSTSFQNIFTTSNIDHDINPESKRNHPTPPSRNLQTNPSGSASHSSVLRQNVSEGVVASVPRMFVSTPASGPELHPSSPFLQFPSITNTASLGTHRQKNVPASIIHSHIPDNIPSSTLDLGDSEPKEIFPNARFIHGDGKRNKNNNRSKDDNPNYSAGLQDFGNSASKTDFLTFENIDNDGNRHINVNNFSRFFSLYQTNNSDILNSLQASVGHKQQPLPLNEHQKSLHSEQTPIVNEQEIEQKHILKQQQQHIQNKEVGFQASIETHKNVQQFQQPPKLNKEYLQLPIFRLPGRSHATQNFKNRETGRHPFRSISPMSTHGEISPHLRNQGNNYQISGIWGILQSPVQSTPVNQALKFESQRIRNIPRSLLDQSRSVRNKDGYHSGGLRQAVSNSETPFARGTYPSSFLVPPPISNSNLQFQRRSDNGPHQQINRRQFSIIPEAANSRHDAVSAKHDVNNLRHPAIVLRGKKSKKGDQAEIYRRHWLYLKAVNPVFNYLEPSASDQAAVPGMPSGVFKPGKYK